MRSLVIAVAGALVAAPALAAAPPIIACSVALWVTDQDPKGLNVRATPDGAIVTALRAKGRNVEVNVTGAAGAWAQIDGATWYQTGSQTTLFQGAGFVASPSSASLGGLPGGWAKAPASSTNRPPARANCSLTTGPATRRSPSRCSAAPAPTSNCGSTASSAGRTTSNSSDPTRCLIGEVGPPRRPQGRSRPRDHARIGLSPRPRSRGSGAGVARWGRGARRGGPGAGGRRPTRVFRARTA